MLFDSTINGCAVAEGDTVKLTTWQGMAVQVGRVTAPWTSQDAAVALKPALHLTLQESPARRVPDTAVAVPQGEGRPFSRPLAGLLTVQGETGAGAGLVEF